MDKLTFQYIIASLRCLAIVLFDFLITIKALYSAFLPASSLPVNIQAGLFVKNKSKETHSVF